MVEFEYTQQEGESINDALDFADLYSEAATFYTGVPHKPVVLRPNGTSIELTDVEDAPILSREEWERRDSEEQKTLEFEVDYLTRHLGA